MSLNEIEAELENLTPEELQALALKSWSVFMAKGGSVENLTECSEEDQRILAALDEAIARADASPEQGHTRNEVLARLEQWITR